MAKHTIDYADVRTEAFSYDLASSSTARGDKPSKRLQAHVILSDCDNGFEPTIKYVVRIGGEPKYEGKDLKLAVETYNFYD